MSDSLRPYGRWSTRPLCPWNSLGKNTGVGCHSLLQGIFPIQGSYPGLPHCRQILYCLSHREASLIFIGMGRGGGQDLICGHGLQTPRQVPIEWDRCPNYQGCSTCPNPITGVHNCTSFGFPKGVNDFSFRSKMFFVLTSWWVVFILVKKYSLKVLSNFLPMVSSKSLLQGLVSVSRLI